jgi:hypothetical protein
MILLADLKTYLGIPESDTSEDQILVGLERNALAFVQTQTRRYFGPPAPTTEYLIGLGTRHLWIPDTPLAAEPDVDPAVVIGEVEAGTDPVPVLDFDLRLFDVDAVAVRHGRIGWQRREYAVSYIRGYPAGEEPGDIRQLVIDLVSIKRTLRGMEALRSESVGGYSYARFGESDIDAVMGGWATINAWRRVVLA